MIRNSANETEIRKVVAGLAHAIHDTNAKAVLSCYAPGSVVLELAPPPQNPTSGAEGETALYLRDPRLRVLIPFRT